MNGAKQKVATTTATAAAGSGRRPHRRNDTERHLAWRAAPTRAYSLGLQTIESRQTSAPTDPRRPRVDADNTVTEREHRGAVPRSLKAPRGPRLVREVVAGHGCVPSSERGCVRWWRSGRPCCQAARERRGPGMAGLCSTLRCGRPRRSLHATEPRTARAPHPPPPPARAPPQPPRRTPTWIRRLQHSHSCSLHLIITPAPPHSPYLSTGCMV